MLMNFDADLSTPTIATEPPRPTYHPNAVTLSESVSVSALPSASRAFLAKDTTDWSWADLRDYVVHEIEARFGCFPRDAKKEYGIFNRFAKEHGQAAGAIARYAFEQCDGFWANAPISVQRFCKGSDVYFALPILDRLDATRVSPL